MSDCYIKIIEEKTERGTRENEVKYKISGDHRNEEVKRRKRTEKDCFSQ